MDASQITALRPALESVLGEFDDCFGRVEPAEHFGTYVKGQLSDLPRKSIEPIALDAGTAPRTLQQFLSRAHWDEGMMRNRLQEIVARDHAHPLAVGILDETSYAKKGDKTPGVKRQHCGATGKTDNCCVTVHLGYATPDGFHALLDGDLFLPQDWTGRPIASAARPPASPMRWCIEQKEKSRWSFLTVRWQTGCVSRG